MTPPTVRQGRPARSGAELRRFARRPASDVPDLKARLVAGSDVRLVNVSRRGVLLETDARLMPNSAVTLRFVTDAASVVLKGRVVRSSIAVLSKATLVYRTAVEFDQDISLVDPRLWDEPVAPIETLPGTDVAANAVADTEANTEAEQTLASAPDAEPELDPEPDAAGGELAPVELLVNAEVDGEWLDLSHLLN